MIGRRNFLRASMAAPFAAKQVAEKAAMEVSGNWVIPTNFSSDPQGIPSPILGAGQWRSVLATAAGKAEVRSILAEEERFINRIDPDLAVLKSFSLNAKIVFQRQRNIERRLENLQKEYPWRRLEEAAKRILGIKT